MILQTPQSTDFSTDEKVVRDLYQQIIDGFNKKDGELFAAPFTEDADFILFDGYYVRGREEIASFHQKLFDEHLKDTRLIAKIRRVRFLTPEVVTILAVNGTMTVGHAQIEPERNSIQTLVAMKGDGGKWQFVMFHNSRAQFVGRPDLVEALTEELQELL